MKRKRTLASLGIEEVRDVMVLDIEEAWAQHGKLFRGHKHVRPICHYVAVWFRIACYWRLKDKKGKRDLRKIAETLLSGGPHPHEARLN